MNAATISRTLSSRPAPSHIIAASAPDDGDPLLDRVRLVDSAFAAQVLASPAISAL